jgi:hypothetical protein
MVMQSQPPADVLGAGVPCFAEVDLVVGHPSEELFQGDPGFHPGQVYPEADVGAVAEPDHPLRPPTDEIAIRLGELARVSVGAGEEEADPLTRNQPVAVELELLGHRASLELGGSVQPERLVKGLELQPRIGSDQAALDRVTVQADEGGREDLGERIGGGDEEVHQGADDPRLGHDRTVDRRRHEDPGQGRRRPGPRPRLSQMLGDVGE